MLILAGEHSTPTIIGWGVVGVAVTVALSLMFLEVGYSEDRARARERRSGHAGRGPGAQRFSR